MANNRNPVQSDEYVGPVGSMQRYANALAQASGDEISLTDVVYRPDGGTGDLQLDEPLFADYETQLANDLATQRSNLDYQFEQFNQDRAIRDAAALANLGGPGLFADALDAPIPIDSSTLGSALRDTGRAVANSAINILEGVPNLIGGLALPGAADYNPFLQEYRQPYDTSAFGATLEVLGGFGALRALGTLSGALSGVGSTRGSIVAPSIAEASAGVVRGPFTADRLRALRSAITDSNGIRLGRDEISGIRYTIGRVEAQGFRLDGAIKYKGNQGIDLAFNGIDNNVGRYALAEAKASSGLGSLGVDSQGIRQGSFDFFDTRLGRAGRTDLQLELRSGNVDLFGGFAGSDRLFNFDPILFARDVNFRTTTGAAVLVP